jgi:hypothetical protein
MRHEVDELIKDWCRRGGNLNAEYCKWWNEWKPFNGIKDSWLIPENVIRACDEELERIDILRNGFLVIREEAIYACEAAKERSGS